MANPILVNATRGGIIESAHRGAYAIATTDGVVARLGDIDTPIFPRSSIKIFQAVPLVTSGAADAFALADEHLALACASHDGEPTHVTAATAMLHASGAELDALACGAHAPSGRRAADALVAAGEQP
ncbi:MAG: asparaginase, partial [Pseudomonadota bacterium]